MSMDAVRYLKESERRCDSFDDHCAGCEIKSAKNGMTCGAYIKKISGTGGCHCGEMVGGTSAGNKIYIFFEVFSKCNIA